MGSARVIRSGFLRSSPPWSSASGPGHPYARTDPSSTIGRRRSKGPSAPSRLFRSAHARGHGASDTTVGTTGRHAAQARAGRPRGPGSLEPDLVLLGGWTVVYVVGPENGDGANIEIPLRHLDGLVIKRGAMFDFWRAVGEVSRGHGYRRGASSSAITSIPTARWPAGSARSRPRCSMQPREPGCNRPPGEPRWVSRQVRARPGRRGRQGRRVPPDPGVPQ